MAICNHYLLPNATPLFVSNGNETEAYSHCVLSSTKAELIWMRATSESFSIQLLELCIFIAINEFLCKQHVSLTLGSATILGCVAHRIIFVGTSDKSTKTIVVLG